MQSRHHWFAGVAFLGWLAFAGCSRSEEGPTGKDSAQQKPSAAEYDSEGRPEAHADKTGRSRTAGVHRPHPIVELQTSEGLIKIRLEPDKAPRTVNNFLHYVESKHYDHTIFHQVESGYVILGGGYSADLAEKPARYPIPNEAENGLTNRRGTIAMARQWDEIDSSTCQFFINLQDNPGLDHQGESPEEYGYCVFGEVIDGLDVVERIARADVHDTEQFEKLPVRTVSIESARRVR